MEEVIGAQLAASMLPKARSIRALHILCLCFGDIADSGAWGREQMKALGIDGHVLRFLDHDGWKQLGVEDTIARSRLLSRQHQVGMIV